MDITYRVVTDFDDLEQVVDLEIEIWTADARDAVPAHILHTLTLNGSVLVVAEAGPEMVGLCLGSAARQAKSWYLWSHMAGVHPDYQGQGIGFQLKQMQRDWALHNGYKEIRWTFDPLQRGNANFNIHKLGATANRYHINYYGKMMDGINAGLPSDRLEVSWQLKRNIRANVPKQNMTIDAAAIWLKRSSPDNKPQLLIADASSNRGYVEIPENISELKRQTPELALQWRLALRDMLKTAFRRGYTITDFVPVNDRWYYCLTAPQPWYMYVVECADGSLYTGITNHVEKRIKKHNTGKGAAYTVSRRPVSLLATWKFIDRSAALKSEAAFKKQSRPAKLAQITAQTNYQGGEFVKSP